VKATLEITEIAEEKLNSLLRSGILQGGHNGPYYDQETPVRVSAHWIFIFSWLYDIKKDNRYFEAVKMLAEYLYKERIESSYAFTCRIDERKDHVNGTIGQAWAIEGLIRAAIVLHDNKYYELAVEVFNQHKFNNNFAIWNRTEIDGRLLGYDNTFNHQLWLAAAGAQIIRYKFDQKIDNQIRIFLDACKNTDLFRVYPDGVVKHFAFIPGTLKERVKFYKKELINDFRCFAKKPSMYYKERGYHYFCMYGFALVFQTYQDHPLFQCKKFKKALDFTFEPKNLKALEVYSPQNDATGLAKNVHNTSVNIYGYAYNSPAFELPFIYKCFKGNLPELFVDQMWEKQMEITKNSEGWFSKNNEDSITLEARVYEFVRAMIQEEK